MTKHIGRYELGEELGQGGFGRVYRAHDPAVKRMVAIKTLTAAEDADSLRRFRNEAASAGRLHHPNIVIVYDFGEHEGSPYLVMELLDGEDLGKIMEAGRPMTMLKAVDVMIQVAGGLHHAHTRGVIHRDVKPANIMILPDGTAKVLDFGIALVTQLTAETRITRDGSMLGTLKYMSPEQFDGAPPGVPSDIFAYGVTFYKLLSGKHPFEAPQVAEVMRNIVSVEPPTLRSINPECPEALSAAIGRMLAKNPQARYQTLDDVRLDLGPILGQLKRQASTPFLLDARLALEAGDLESAQRNLKGALEIEPESEEAQTLQQRIRKTLREREFARQFSELSAGAERDLAAHQYESAIGKIEAALRISPQDKQLQQQLAYAKEALGKRRYADDMASKAGEATRIGRWDLAKTQLIEAIAADPSHSEAQTLLIEVEAQLAEQQRQQAFARQRELQRQIAELSANAEEDLAAHQYESAIGKIEAALRISPQDKQLQQQLAYAKEELGKRRYADDMASKAGEATRIGRWDLAKTQLIEAIAADPSHSEAQTLLIEVEAQLAEQQRQQAFARQRELQRQIAELSANAEEDLAGRRLDAAMAKIAAGLQLDANDPRLREQRERAQKMLRDRQFCDALTLEAARAQKNGDLNLASQKLHAAIATDPGYTAAATLLGEVTQQIAEQELRRQKEDDLRRQQLEKLAAEARSKQQEPLVAQAVEAAPAVAYNDIPRRGGKAKRSTLVWAAVTFVVLNAAGALIWLNPGRPKGEKPKISIETWKPKRIEPVTPPPQAAAPTEVPNGGPTAALQNSPQISDATHSADENAKRMTQPREEKKATSAPVAAVHPKLTVAPPPLPAPVEIRPSLPASSVDAEQEEVRKALRGFSAAIRQKDVALLKQAWPSIPKSDLERWGQKFESAESLSFELTPGAASIQGAIARVECDGASQERYAGSANSYTSRRVVHVSLQKLDGQWKIATVR